MELVIKSAAEDILAALQLDEASVRVQRKEQIEGTDLEQYLVDIKTTDAPILIGSHGESLRALQHLLRLVTSKKAKELNRKITLLVDIDGYRQRQEEEFIALALRRAEQVRTSGNPIKLPPMSSYQRRLIHIELAKEQWTDIVTDSIGARGLRAVVIKKA